MTNALPEAPKPGEIVDGRFRLLHVLGSGNFGTVYEAEQLVFGLPIRTVALKILRGDTITPINAPELLKDAIFLMHLQQEADHDTVAKHLVQVIDAGLLGDRRQVYISLEYVGGYQAPSGAVIKTLEGMIRAFHPVPLDLAVRWMLQIVRPLAWMHSLHRPVLHCDLKPDNILVSGNDTLKIADFGLAQWVFGIVGSSSAGGALAWQSPEGLTGTYPTPAADVYSLGLILYAILAGSNPFLNIGNMELAAGVGDAYRHAQLRARAEGPPSVSECGHPELADDPLLIAIVERCLRLRAPDRYDNAGMLLRDLERYAVNEEIAVVSSAPASNNSARDPGPGKLLAEAKLFMSKGQFDAARERCELARTQFPKSAKPYRWLAEILLQETNDWEVALQVCAEGMNLDPTDPDLYEVACSARIAGNQPLAAAKMREEVRRLRGLKKS